VRRAQCANAPFRVYLTCYRILQAHHDPRALAILRVAHERLQARAATIGDERLRRSFPEHVPAHRELVIEFKGQARIDGTAASPCANANRE